jgi:3-oxoacyl-[acyl-carrier-protein] synthase II
VAIIRRLPPHDVAGTVNRDTRGKTRVRRQIPRSGGNVRAVGAFVRAACREGTDRLDISSTMRELERRRVAVTGLGVVSPVGIGTATFWDALTAGRSGIRELDGPLVDGEQVRIAGEVRDFTPEDWLGVKDVKRLDRFCQLALAAADMAVSEAEFDPADGTRVGTVFGSGIGGVATAQRGVIQHHLKGPARIPPLTIPSSIPNMAAAQIAMRYGFGGPSVCPVTACASSADAVGWAFRLVRDGYADACVAGGAEACVRTVALAGFAIIRALSTRNHDPEGACRPFDATRDGFVLAEGAGALLLERYDHALARGAPIHAEVCGYGQSSDAFHETAPQVDGGGAARAIREALAEADHDPADVAYVNAHATGTPLADATETRALRLALGDHANRVAVSSTKSMTGHMLGAAGAVEAIATILTLREQVIPPTINYETPDPDCDLDCVPNVARRAEVDVALSDAMAFGGHNVCLAFRRPV